MANHLQFIGASIGFYRTSLTLLVQEKRSAENGQKIFSTIFKKNFFDWFLLKVNHNRTPLFFGVSHGEHVSKVIHFGEKVQNHKKICQKSWLFRKNLIFVTSTFPHFGGLYMRLPYVLLWLLGETVQDVWFCGNFSENVNKGCFLSGVHMISKIFLC